MIDHKLKDVISGADAPSESIINDAPLEVHHEDGLLVIRRSDHLVTRRVLHINNYGMAEAWRLWKEGVYPGQHLWGCLELARLGYEVLLPEPIPGGGIRKRLVVDMKLALSIARRLSSNDIIYCSQNILLWTPMMRALRQVRASVVGLLYAHEALPLGSFYQGVIGMTPAGMESAKRFAPRAKHIHLGWGMELPFYHHLPYDPKFALSCGKTYRDFPVVAEAFAQTNQALKMICPESSTDIAMPDCVERISKGNYDSSVSYKELKDYYYRHASYVLIALQQDLGNKRAVGFTNILEAMAMARPVIVTRTGAIVDEIDVEKHGIGLFVEPGNTVSLKRATEYLIENPDEAQSMGLRGRELCESYYNMDRFGTSLHAFFEAL